MSLAALRKPFSTTSVSHRPRSLVVRPARTSSVRTHAFLDFFKPKPAPAKAPVKVVRPTVIPEPAYNLQLALLAIAGFEFYEGWTPVAAFTAFLGVWLLYQTTRVQFVFDDEGLEVLIRGQESDNVVVGGRNRWPYDSFVNWEMWWPAFPILVYYKETQTKAEGQIHFFPIIFNGKQLYDVMVERCGPSQNSGPKN